MSFVDETQGACWLAPLTRGGNLPFRKLCARLGCRASVTEMAFARQLIRKSAKELASIRIHGIDEVPARLGVQRCANTINTPNDYSSYNEIRERRNIVGIQIATKTIDEGLEAIGITRNVDETIKSDFIDINCGCPIYEVAQKRGMGAALLRKPHKLSRLLKGIVDGSCVPVTAKVRLSPKGESEINIFEIADAIQDAGVEMLTIHGRTTNARYSKAADWDLIAEVANRMDIPVVGNGDILTLFEAQNRLENYSVHSVMIGRAALIKPWIYKEIVEGREWFPSSTERTAIFLEFTELMRSHFGSDDVGRRHAMYFLPWHFDFFCRYRPYPADVYKELSYEYPLMQSRIEDDYNSVSDLDTLEQLLRVNNNDAHIRICDILWDVCDSETTFDEKLQIAAERLTDLGEQNLKTWNEANNDADTTAEMKEGRG